MSRRSGFTLIEIIFTLIVLSVIAAVGVRMMVASDEAKRFHETVQRMYIIRDKLIGDERIMQCGRRVDFGYFGKHGAFPAGLDDLSSVWPTVNPFMRSSDAWSTQLSYDGPAGTSDVITIASAGANGTVDAGDTGFDTDIDMEFNVPHFAENDVYVFCKDVHGTLLRGIDYTDSTTYDYHIWKVEVTAGGQTFSYPEGTNGFAYDAKGYWYVEEAVPAGQCQVKVYIADGLTNAGSRKYCNKNRCSELTSSSMAMVEVYECINPVSVLYDSTNYKKSNIIEVRLPGAVGSLH